MKIRSQNVVRICSFLYHSYKFCKVSILKLTDPKVRIKGLKNKTDSYLPDKSVAPSNQYAPPETKDSTSTCRTGAPLPFLIFHLHLAQCPADLSAQYMPHEWEETSTSYNFCSKGTHAHQKRGHVCQHPGQLLTHSRGFLKNSSLVSPPFLKVL